VILTQDPGMEHVMSTSTMLAGRYRLSTELGRGGMGVVWQAYDELLHREVAVKEVNFPADLPAEDRERLADRTLREARAVAAVDTQAAVRVFDIVEQEGRPWIVMELVRGRTLTALLRERAGLPPAEVATIGLALLEALETAHSAGVLHRDVKPSNVLIGNDGRVALTDFGIATVDGDGDTTTTGVIVGSPSYVAPERVHGEASTPAADLWSLGATLWTAVEGRPPYAGDSPIITMTAVANTDPPASRRAGDRLGDLLCSMMDRDPRRRPDAQTVRQELESVRDGATAQLTEPFPAGPATTEALPLAFDRTTVLDPTGTHPTPAPASAPAPAPARTGEGRRRSLLAAAIGVIALAVIAVALVATTPWSGDDSTTGSKGGADKQQSSSQPQTPSGWTRYRDPQLGWTVAVPRGWTQSTAADGTRFTDPSGDRYLLVATRYPAGSSAVGAWEDSERTFRSSHSDYQRLRLESIDVDGARDAADWEFTYTDGGAALHALDRAMVFGNRGYALYFQTHSERWDS
jgi:serine/threonine protein kinase